MHTEVTAAENPPEWAQGSESPASTAGEFVETHLMMNHSRMFATRHPVGRPCSRRTSRSVERWPLTHGSSQIPYEFRIPLHIASSALCRFIASRHGSSVCARRVGARSQCLAGASYLSTKVRKIDRDVQTSLIILRLHALLSEKRPTGQPNS